MRPISSSKMPHFGSVPVETVENALETSTRFEIRMDGKEAKVATLAGPFVKQEATNEIAHIVCDGMPGVDSDRPLELYVLGFHYEDPRHKTADASHGVVPVQGGMVHGLDLIG